MNLGLCMQISHDARLHDPDPGPQEKSTEKSIFVAGAVLLHGHETNKITLKHLISCNFILKLDSNHNDHLLHEFRF